MTEVNWDLAPDGAVEIKTNGVVCRFFNAEGKMYTYGGEGWGSPSLPSDWQTVATRPATSEPHKTVEDVVEAYPDGWPEKNNRFCAWDSRDGVFRFWHTYSDIDGCYLVCDKGEFEACVKAKEGEKWTHIDQCGCRCKILIDDPDSTGYLVLVDEGGEYGLAKYDDLEPIEKSKPTISDEQLSLILDAASAWGVDPDVCQDYLSGFRVEGASDKCEF